MDFGRVLLFYLLFDILLVFPKNGVHKIHTNTSNYRVYEERVEWIWRFSCHDTSFLQKASFTKEGAP